jgi:two-component system response regulator HydG
LVNQLKILVIDDDGLIRDACKDTLVRSGHDVDLAESGTKGLALLNRWAYDVVLLDLRMPEMDGMTVLSQIKEQDPETVVIVISGYGSVTSAVQAMKLGAFDFLPKPFTPADLRRAVDMASEKRRLTLENFFLKEELKRKNAPGRVVANSEAMKQILELLDRLAPTGTTVLCTGESGTGKGLLARRLHELSPRREHPFVSVDCSTLVPTLFESELFGHVKGAFTGAGANKIGKFELSTGGTLFLDEVGNISLEIQAKLLKAVEERTICKVGSNRVIRVDTRLIAATNRDLGQAVKDGTFREDLFYRLNVMEVHLPPLRRRPEDIPPLVDLFLEMYRGMSSVRVRGFAQQALDLLCSYDWPGNIRELQNTVQRLTVMATNSQIGVSEVESALPNSSGQAPQEEAVLLSEIERQHIEKTLRRLGGHMSRTAQALGIDRKTLRLKLRKYGLNT